MRRDDYANKKIKKQILPAPARLRIFQIARGKSRARLLIPGARQPLLACAGRFRVRAFRMPGAHLHIRRLANRAIQIVHAMKAAAAAIVRRFEIFAAGAERVAIVGINR